MNFHYEIFAGRFVLDDGEPFGAVRDLSSLLEKRTVPLPMDQLNEVRLILHNLVFLTIPVKILKNLNFSNISKCKKIDLVEN